MSAVESGKVFYGDGLVFVPTACSVRMGQALIGLAAALEMGG